MKTLYFNCKLLSDVIISETAATSTHQKTLDFIPGSNFLGICAKSLYKNSDESMLTLFHTGDVQFGDAHLKVSGLRSLRIPASMYYPKLKNVEEVCYIHHGHKRDDKDDKKEQLKQCRKGFYSFNMATKEAVSAAVGTSYAIKSAYDYGMRRAKDEQMYGYESMNAGMEFLFEVRICDTAISYIDIVNEALVGTHHLGRSKTAQYGLVKITEASKEGFPSYDTNESKDIEGNSIQIVYADSRLIFIDEETLLPKLRIDAQDLGFNNPGAKVKWDLSQIRTFQYAPWNNQRQSRDADRCGIEKGSVIVVEGATAPPECNVVGNFRNEGFGKVIYNPTFLDYKEDGLATWKIKNKKDDIRRVKSAISETSAKNKTLLSFLRGKKEEMNQESTILTAVNKFVDKNKDSFRSEQFASQWGTIRVIAIKYNQESTIGEIKKFLEHGVAKDKWEKNGGKKRLLDFLESNEKSLDIKKLVINLASQMQKAIK